MSKKDNVVPITRNTGAKVAPGIQAVIAPKRASNRAKPERVPLKAERVQLTAGGVQDRLKAERVQEALRSMPGWRLGAGSRTIDRVRQFPNPSSAAAFVSFLAGLAVDAGQPVVIELAGDQVAVTLRAKPQRDRRANLDEAVLDFARVLG